MKIVDIAESYSEHGGGVKTYMRQKLAAAQRHGCEVVVVAPGEHDYTEELPGGKIVWIKSRRSPFDARYGLFTSEQQIHDVIDREMPDVVEASSILGGAKYVASYPGQTKKVLVFHTDAVAVWPQTFFGRRVGFDRIDQLFHPYWSRIRALSDSYDATVVSGGWLKRRLDGFGWRNAMVVPFGIDKDRFVPDRFDPQLRAELLDKCNLPPTADLVVAVGRLDPEKRIGTILDAFKKASAVRPMGLVMLGRGALQRWYQARVNRMPHAVLEGYVPADNVASIISSADAFIHASCAETFGIAVAEAICAGTGVVVPDRGGAGAFCGPVYSAPYQAADSDACAQSLLELLSRDRSRVRTACGAMRNQIPDTRQHFARLFEEYERLAAPMLPRTLPRVPVPVVPRPVAAVAQSAVGS